MDFSNRDAVKRYLEHRYGYDYVASIGTYGYYKVKSIFNDICRASGIDSGTTRYMSAIISKEYENGGYTSLIECCVRNRKLRDFVEKIIEKVDHYPAILENPRNSSVHASGLIIVPKEDDEGNPMNIYSYMPVKKVEGHLVTEWEGKQLEKVGFLKEDILGISQLEKFEKILEFIERNTGERINIFDIPLDDKKTFGYFAEGITEDVFQFGTAGLKSYCKELEPNSIEELTAANALYRPGAMESNAHKTYIDLKFDRAEPEYDELLKDVTVNTGGLYIYQEQVMLAFQKITDGTLSEADTFRKIITKTKPGKANPEVDKYKEIFVSNYVKKGVEQEYAENVWDKLISFAKYGFNRSHALCYSIIGYMSMWFKVHYPLEFWMVSLEKSVDDIRPRRLNEINEYFDIKVRGVDINKSRFGFEIDKDENAIFYSLSSVKFVGESSVVQIVEERDKNGLYFSLKDFIDRVPKKYANKRTTTNLILCGAFDLIENLQSERERFKLLDEFYLLTKAKGAIDSFTEYRDDEFWWGKTKAELSGIGFLNYKEKSEDLGFKNFVYDVEGCKLDSIVSFGGQCLEVSRKNSQNGEFAIIKINCNSNVFQALAWNEFFKNKKQEILNSQGNFIFLSGIVKYDSYNDCKTLYLNSYSQIKVVR